MIPSQPKTRVYHFRQLKWNSVSHTIPDNNFFKYLHPESHDYNTLETIEFKKPEQMRRNPVFPKVLRSPFSPLFLHFASNCIDICTIISSFLFHRKGKSSPSKLWKLLYKRQWRRKMSNMWSKCLNVSAVFFEAHCRINKSFLICLCVVLREFDESLGEDWIWDVGELSKQLHTVLFHSTFLVASCLSEFLFATTFLLSPVR